VVFADDPATVWDVAALNALANAPTENADYIAGTANDDVIYSLGGNDTLIGDAGNDILNGGAGSDMLQGGFGNDTYLFNLGGVKIRSPRMIILEAIWILYGLVPGSPRAT